MSKHSLTYHPAKDTLPCTLSELLKDALLVYDNPRDLPGIDRYNRHFIQTDNNPGYTRKGNTSLTVNYMWHVFGIPPEESTKYNIKFKDSIEDKLLCLDYITDKDLMGCICTLGAFFIEIQQSDEIPLKLIEKLQRQYIDYLRNRRGHGWKPRLIRFLYRALYGKDNKYLLSDMYYTLDFLEETKKDLTLPFHLRDML